MSVGGDAGYALQARPQPCCTPVSFWLSGLVGRGGCSSVFAAWLDSADPCQELQLGKPYIIKLDTLHGMEALQRGPTFTTAGHLAAGVEEDARNRTLGCQHVMNVEGTFLCGTLVDVPAELQEEWQQQAVANHKAAAAALHPVDIPAGYELDDMDKGISTEPARE